MEWITTSTILERLRDFDNHDAWGRFCAQFRQPLVSFARRYGLSATEAEDTAQEILLAFAEAYRGGKYDPAKGRLSSWLFGIAYRQIASARRKRLDEQRKCRAPDGPTSFWEAFPDEAQASQAWDAEWEQHVLDRCLAQARREVAEKTYRAFEIVVREARPADEAAVELGLSREAVYVAKHRVLKRLSELMKDYEALPEGS